MNRCPFITVIDDNQADVLLIREAIESADIGAELRILYDGEEARQYFAELERNETLTPPDLILLDLNMPKLDGAEVLEFLRKTSRFRNAIVIVVTSADPAHDADNLRRYGFARYFRKPSSYSEFMRLGQIVKDLIPAAHA